MVTGTATVTKMGQGFTAMVSKVQAMTKKEVLVGIPQAEAQRPGDGDMVNNAELLYIHTHGVRTPAMRASMQQSINAGMKYSAAHSLYVQTHGSLAGAERGLELAGMVAQNAARAWFENPKNKWPPNSARTIKAKGSNSPLIDTGEMRKSITYVIRDMG